MVEDVFGIMGNTLAGTFHVEEVIAEGGFGVVYRAEHVAFRAPVALKCLKVPGTISPSQSELFVENFREEAEILFHLSAQIPEVVRPLHADALTLEDGTFVPYIAMEWIDGRPLDSIIIMRDDDGLPPLAPKKVLKMLTPIAHALNRAHNFQVPGGAIVSVTHCDLKPENILITERDSPVRAKILDFGIAKARDAVFQAVGRITDTEANRPFTPSYGAPEQWVPKRYGQTGPWTDVWGMALTLVECLTGRPPIEGDMHAMMGTALDKAHRPTPRSEGIAIGDDLEAVFNRGLAVDPRQRYQSIEDFWSALEAALGMPSSFARAKRRRQDPTFDDVSEQLPPSASGADPDEFGLELEADEPASFRGRGGSEKGRDSDRGVDGRGPRSQDGQDSSVDSLEFDLLASDAPRSDSIPPAAFSGKGSIKSDEFMLESGNAPPTGGELSALAMESEPPSFDLADDLIPPSSRGSDPQGGSGAPSWSQPDLNTASIDTVSVPPISAAPSMSSRRGPAKPSAAGGGTLRSRSTAAVQTAAEETRGLREQLRVPLILVAVGLALTILDMVLARTAGGTLSIGPVRLRWVAAGLAGVGIMMAFWNLLGDKEE